MIGRRFIVVGTAIVLALFGTLSVSSYVRGADARALAGQQQVKVLVAVKTVPAGVTGATAVAKGLVKPTTLARKAVPADALTSIDSVKDQVALSDIVPGELLLPTRFGSQAPARTGISLPAGDVAVTVSLEDPQHVGSFVVPGASVAVYDTFVSATGYAAPWIPAGNGISQDFKYNHATRVLLSRVTVLAVGASTGAATQKTAATTGPATATVLVTLSVDQRQAAKLIQGAQVGHLYLALLDARSHVDDGTGVDNRTLFDGK